MTISYEHVRRSIRLSRLLSAVSVLLGSLALIVCFGLSLIHFGFDRGYEISKDDCASYESRIAFSPAGPRTYEFLAHKYEYIAGWLLLFLVLELVHTQLMYNRPNLGIVSRIFGLSSLVLAAYQISWLFAEKGLRSQSQFWDKSYDSMLRNSVPYDWFVTIVVGGLLVVQIADTLLALIENSRQVKKSFE